MRRQHETVVVGVGHDERTHKARAHAPARGPSVVGLIVLIDKLHIEGTAEVLPEEVARAALQGLAVLHHGFNSIGVERTGKAFRFALHAAHHGNGEHIACKVGINVEHLAGTLFCLLARGMGGVAFLPQELAGTQEEAGAHLPAHHVAPLVAEHGQVAPRMNPLAVSVPNRRFARGADYQFFLELCGGVNHHAVALGVGFEAIVRHHGALLGKAFHVFGFFREKTFRDEQREINVLHTSLLETRIKRLLDLFPNGIAVRFYHHAAAHVCLLGKVGFHNKFVIPF